MHYLYFENLEKTFFRTLSGQQAKKIKSTSKSHHSVIFAFERERKIKEKLSEVSIQIVNC